MSCYVIYHYLENLSFSLTDKCLSPLTKGNLLRASFGTMNELRKKAGKSGSVYRHFLAAIKQSLCECFFAEI